VSAWRSVDVRSLTLRLTDSAMASDLFPAAYHACTADEAEVPGEEPTSKLPLRWMALELLDAVDDHRTVVCDPAGDVVSNKCIAVRKVARDRYGNSHATREHTVLPATRQR